MSFFNKKVCVLAIFKRFGGVICFVHVIFINLEERAFPIIIYIQECYIYIQEEKKRRKNFTKYNCTLTISHTRAKKKKKKKKKKKNLNFFKKKIGE